MVPRVFLASLVACSISLVGLVSAPGPASNIDRFTRLELKILGKEQQRSLKIAPGLHPVWPAQ